MFSILSLFTEDVKLRRGSRTNDVEAKLAQEANQSRGEGASPMAPSPITSPMPESPRTHFAESRRNLSSQSRARSSSVNLQDIPYIPLLNPPQETQEEKKGNSVHPGIIARANIDTTIAVIPAEVNLNTHL